jgi:KDO2-lipid IV(A) lauroyltransferase
MSRPRSAVVDYTAFLAIRVAVCIGQTITWDLAIAIARFLSWVAQKVDRRHVAIAEENLRHAFPDLNAAAITSLRKKSFDHLFEMAIEIVRVPRLVHRSNAYEMLPFATAEQLKTATDYATSGRPLMVLTGHFGNWEILSYAIGAAGFHANLIARRLDNPYLDRFVNQFRRKTGQQILDKNSDYDKIQQTLADCKTLGMVGDQDAGPRGLFLPFMNRPASTYKSIALLSLEFSAPIMVLAAARVGSPMKYVLYLEDVIEPAEFQSSRDPVRGITERYSAALERVVRRHPEQYFWVHRRWKHQPKEREKKKAA